MTGSELVDQPDAKPRRRQSMDFRKRNKAPLPTPDQSRRQSDLVQAAWRHFREAGPMIAFLNPVTTRWRTSLCISRLKVTRASRALNGC